MLRINDLRRTPPHEPRFCLQGGRGSEARQGVKVYGIIPTPRKFFLYLQNAPKSGGYSTK